MFQFKSVLLLIIKSLVFDFPAQSTSLIGYGDDPWGGYRMGLEASTTLKLSDFGITKNLGPASETVEIIISVEGIKK